jgi:alkanesulfonate monooxygenase
MSLKIIGLLYHQLTSKIRETPAVDFDLQVIKDLALAHEESGYDSVLVSQSATMPDPLMIGAYVAAITTRLGFLLAHRPGFIAPTMAARMFATIDRLSGGRATVHVISGAHDSEMLKDGDTLTKEERYLRSREYVQIMRRMWTSEAPFDFDGDFYKFRQAFCDVKPTRREGLVVSWAGASQLAFETAGECADIYAMVGDTPATARDYMGKASAVAARHNRRLDFTITLCIILGDTEEEAWGRARAILAKAEADAAARGGAAPKLASAAFQAMLSHSQTDVVGKNLWMALNRVSGGVGNNTTVVGTAAQIIETLLIYYDLGFTHFLLRGFEPLDDARAFGRTLIPEFRRAVANRGPAAQRRALAGQ